MFRKWNVVHILIFCYLVFLHWSRWRSERWKVHANSLMKINPNLWSWYLLKLVKKIVYYHCVFLFADENDLRDMISAVTSLAGRWKDLGISLGVRAGDLDTILSNNPNSSSDRLREVLTLWLRQSYNVRITLIYIIIHTTPSPNTTPCSFFFTMSLATK